MKNKLKSLYQGTVALLLGTMLMVAFAPFKVFPLAIISLAGLCALIYHASSKRSFWLGFLFGIGLFGSGVYWIFISINRYGDVPDAGSFGLTAALIAFLALYPAAACYVSSRYFAKSPRSKIIYAFPAAWILFEWVRSWLLTGFPWLIIGYSQTNSPLKGYAPILSVYGVSLAILLTSALIVDGVIQFRKSNYKSTYYAFFAVVCIWTAGSLLSLIPWTQATGKPITVGLVQGNIPQSLKWNPESVKLSFSRYQDLSKPLWGKTDLIIWPEMAIPVPLPNSEDFVNEMSSKAKKNNTQLIFGIPIEAGNNGYYNAIVSVGKSEAVYLKRHLVPFGEYVPFRNIFARAFDFMNVPMSNLQPGKMQQNQMILGNIHIMPSICYEITYPMLSRSADPAMNIILTITNDAWFGKSTAQAQHLQMAQMRSIEMGRPGLFVSNDGITAIIDHKGLVKSMAPTHKPFVLHGSVQSYAGFTPWMRNGMDPVLAIIIVLFALAYRTSRKSNKKSNTAK